MCHKYPLSNRSSAASCFYAGVQLGSVSLSGAACNMAGAAAWPTSALSACTDISVLGLFSWSFEGPMLQTGHQLPAPQRPCVEGETPVYVASAFGFYVPFQSPAVLTGSFPACSVSYGQCSETVCRV